MKTLQFVNLTKLTSWIANSLYLLFSLVQHLRHSFASGVAEGFTIFTLKYQLLKIWGLFCLDSVRHLALSSWWVGKWFPVASPHTNYNSVAAVYFLIPVKRNVHLSMWNFELWMLEGNKTPVLKTSETIFCRNELKCHLFSVGSNCSH